MARYDERGETRGGQQAEAQGYQRTRAIIDALGRGMSEEQIDAALSGRADPTAPGARACAMCGRRTRHLMTSAHGSVCPDCYDDSND